MEAHGQPGTVAAQGKCLFYFKCEDEIALLYLVKGVSVWFISRLRNYLWPPFIFKVDENGKTIRYKLHQGPESYKLGQTKYGVDAFPPERPPIEKLWAQYQAEEAAAATAHH